MQPLHQQDHKVKSATFIQTECRSVAIVIYSGSKSTHFLKQAENRLKQAETFLLEPEKESSETANPKFPSFQGKQTQFLLDLSTEAGPIGMPMNKRSPN